MSVFALILAWAITGVGAHCWIAWHVSTLGLRTGPDLEDLFWTPFLWPIALYDYATDLNRSSS